LRERRNKVLDILTLKNFARSGSVLLRGIPLRKKCNKENKENIND